MTVAYAVLVAGLAAHPPRSPGDIHPFLLDALLDLPAVGRHDAGPPPIEPDAPPEPGEDIHLRLRLPLPGIHS